jgi:uncharacterized protein YbjT (DUF2867 family)
MRASNVGSKAKILVTGATGLSGSIVIREFIRQNIPVRALVRNREKARKFEGYPNVEIVEGNMLQPDTLHDALEGVEKALLISSAFEKMVETQETFIDAAKTAGVPYVIKYSGVAAGIGFNSQNFKPAIDHEKIEDYLIDSGLKWTIIRPSQFMQLYLPGTHSGVNLQKDALILPIKNGMETPVAIEDVAKACVALLSQPGHEGKFYEITGPDAMTMYEACEIISDVIGRKIKYLTINFEEYRELLTNVGISPAGIEILTQLSKERIKSTESHIKLETHKRLGIRPTNFAEFIYKYSSAFAIHQQ